MRNTIVRCSACERALKLPADVGYTSLDCDHCDKSTDIWLFPALHRVKNNSAPQQVVDEGHSSCMNHPSKRAVAVCDGCGKFLCALCDIPWNNDHLCSQCIEHQQEKDADNVLRSTYIHYDRIVLLLAFFSIFLFYLGLFFAPAALFIAWRYWKEPWRPVPYKKWGMITYVTVAFLALVVWSSAIVVAIINL